MGGHEVNRIFINNLLQHLVTTEYPKFSGQLRDASLQTVASISKVVNYTFNENSSLESHPIWTGNLYKYKSEEQRFDYYLIITPECDIAQKKNFKYLIVCGYEVNDSTFPQEYDPHTNPIPRLVERFGKNSRGRWKQRNSVLQSGNLPAHLYKLPFASENGRYIILDFRDVKTLKSETIESKYKLVLRVNDPMITEIMDKFSNLINRKGLIPIPYRDASATIFSRSD